MIISDEHRFAFIHVPKCAGTSVKRSLRPIDDAAGRFERIADHPVMGATHYAHIPLRDLARHFPADFAKVRDYRSLALVRQPMERFLSAVFQRLREFGGLPQSGITDEVVVAEARAVARHLAANPGRLSLDYVHFNRQADFIELDGERIVDHVFAIERLSDAARVIADSTGIAIGPQRENRSTELSLPLLRPLQRLARRPYALVPRARRERIRERLTRAGLYRNVEKRRLVERDAALRDFLRGHYARDFTLYAESC